MPTRSSQTKPRLIDRFFTLMMEKGASDLFLSKGTPPAIRVENAMHRLEEEEPLTDERLHALVDDMLNEEQQEELHSTLELNLALELEERFRVNIFYQRGHLGIVIRLIKSQIPSFEELGLPAIYGDFIMEKRGLLLMVGATGSGKSTSLASMLDYRNERSTGHIITIEDPIEFIHTNKQSIFTQREIGVDTYSYGISLKNALRQSPDVILIGEIRDRETLENAILFCETGHLVVATLHANNANQAIDRIVNLFPEEMSKQVLSTLSQNVHAILSQRLVEGVEGGRKLAYEIMINEGLVRSLIEEGKIKEIKEIMERQIDRGMLSFDQCLLRLIQQREISVDTALKEADNPNNLRLKVSQERLSTAYGGF